MQEVDYSTTEEFEEKMTTSGYHSIIGTLFTVLKIWNAVIKYLKKKQ